MILKLIHNLLQQHHSRIFRPKELQYCHTIFLKFMCIGNYRFPSYDIALMKINYFLLGFSLCNGDYFMAVALLSAGRSKDPNTQASIVYLLSFFKPINILSHSLSVLPHDCVSRLELAQWMKMAIARHRWLLVLAIMDYQMAAAMMISLGQRKHVTLTVK